MAHYAKVLNGLVEKVIVAEADFFNTFIDTTPGEWIKTSYNTKGNTHLLGGTPLRGNFAGIGYTYDSVNDVFYSPKPYLSWTLNTNTWLWDSPIQMPNDNNQYKWNEENLSWDLIEV
jgi:hypothetical protein